MKHAALALLLLAAPAAAQDVLFDGKTGTIGHDNGVMGLGKFLILGSAADLGDEDDSTGVFYPYTPDWYGGPVAGTFGARPFDDGRVPRFAPGQALEVELAMRVRSVKGARIQTFVHRDQPDNNVGEQVAWGALSWVSRPYPQEPRSEPYYGAAWDPTAWTWVRATIRVSGVAVPLTRASLFQSCFGVWVSVPPGGGLWLSEWRLKVRPVPAS